MAGGTDLDPITNALRDRVREEEALYGRGDQAMDSLWDHLERVSRLAERLAREEGLDPLAARLAGLFHDAGKFSQGRYHRDERPEEDRSVECLRALGAEYRLDPGVLEQVAEAILQLYRDDPNPSPMGRVLFDADNLDKVGPLGVANYFVKIGLRGSGVSPGSLSRLSAELTYARHAPLCMTTESGRNLARQRAPETVRFLHHLIETLREDGLYDFRVETVAFKGLTLDVVAPAACTCGGRLDRHVWETPGMKCTEIHLRHVCTSCGKSQELRFCRPRLSD